MKFIRLYLKNLNSLYGEHSVDFTDPAFDAGIFAIIGPTGSGKSTLLDAFALALYGGTPRIASQSITNAGNDLLSIGADELIAELTFEVRGHHYRARFTQGHGKQKRNREKLGKKEHVLYRDESEIASGVTAVPEKITEITGLSRDQFTKAVLLAQGEFNAFLRADTKTRAELLEQITGTGIYRAISMAVYARNEKETAQLALLRQLLQGETLLTPEAETALRHEQETLAAETATLQASLREKNRLQQICENRTRYLAAWNEAENQRLQQEIAAREFAPHAVRLAAAERAAMAEPAYRDFDQLRRQVDQETSELQNLNRERRPALQTACTAAAAQRQAADTALAQYEATRPAEEQLFRQLRLLDQRIAAQDIQCRQLQIDCADRQTQLAARQQQQQQLQRELSQLRQQSQSARQYLADHPTDQDLAARAGVWQEKWRQLTELRRQATAMQKTAATMQQQLREAAAAVEKIRQSIAEFQHEYAQFNARTTRREQAESELLQSRTREELQDLYDLLQQLRNHRLLVASLDEQRRALRDGEPCPLCGATDHPYCQKLPPAEDEARLEQLRQLLNRLSELDRERAECETQRQALEHRRHELDKQQLLAAAKHRELTAAYTAQTEAAAGTTADSDRAAAELESALQSALNLSWRATSVALPPQLRQRIDAYATAAATLEAAAEGERQRTAELAAMSGELANATRELALRDQSRLDAIRQLESLQAARREQFGDMEAETAERAFAARGRQFGAEREKAAREELRLQTELANLEQDCRERRQQLSASQTAQSAAYIRLQAALLRYDFTAETDLAAALLPPEELTRLRSEQIRLDQARREIAARQAEYRKLSEEATGQLPPELDEMRLRDELATLTVQLAEHQQRHGALTAQLAENARRRTVVAERQAEIMQQEKRSQVWQNLNRMIGSRDGTAFCRIAQGITFGQLLSFANVELAKMSDRYRLLCDREEPLILRVLDGYQGGEIRSAENLSGGESFLVSLALALGLAAMASRNIELGNVLLDEGFGTLDEAARTQALNVLANLKESGKLVGVISHVPQIAELVTTQIRVIPQGGGRSRLEGAGVK